MYSHHVDCHGKIVSVMYVEFLWRNMNIKIELSQEKKCEDVGWTELVHDKSSLVGSFHVYRRS
jgi:hypothetical protein